MHIRGAGSRVLREWLVVSGFGAILVGLTAWWPVHVSAGWFDQRFFHWPTIRTMAGELPTPDLVDIKTATGPAYHLIAAPIAWLTDSVNATQFVMGVLCWAAVAGAVLMVTASAPALCRYLILIATLASPYVLQGTLWMTTDALTLALAILGVAMALRVVRSPDVSTAFVIGLGLISAFACATRQTTAWLVVVAAVAVMFSPMDSRRKPGALAAVSVPAIVVLVGLIALWGGLTPSKLADSNDAGAEPLGLPVGFALWAMFAAPLLVPLWQLIRWDTKTIIGMTLAAVACSIPAVIWTSTAHDPERKGGWLWSVVGKTGGILDRSPALIVLAAVGAAAVFLILRTMATEGSTAQAWVLGSAIYTSIIVSMAGSYALPKYREIPLLACFAFVAVAVIRMAPKTPTASRLILAALAIPAAVQTLSAIGTIGVPVLRYLIDPSSIPEPEWTHNMRD